MDAPWHRFYDPGVPTTVEYPDVSLSKMLEDVARRHPAEPATSFYGKRQTYGQLQAEVERFSVGLINAGFATGDRLAVMLPNVPQFPIAFYGALRAGMVVVPTNPLYKARELHDQLLDSGAVAIVALPQLLETVDHAVAGTDVRLVIVAHIDDALPAIKRIPYRVKNRGKFPTRASEVASQSWKDMTAATGGSARDGASEDLAVLQYTGGTTGTSKAAMLTHRSLLANAIQVYVWQAEIRERISTLCVTPFFHVYGLTVGMNMTIWGHGLMILAPRFEAENARKLIKKHRPNLFPGVPTMYVAMEALVSIQPDDLSSLEICISGAAPLPAAVQADFARIAPTARLVEGYGLTEASPVTHCNPCNGCRPGTVGVPFPDTDAAILEPGTWTRLPVGEVGEVAAWGPQVMAGYWKQPNETDRVLKDRWLRTGDMGFIDEDGFLHIVDRIKDMIIAGGYNIYPREIEEVLFHHPAVLEASVVGIQSDYRGETVRAFIVLRQGDAATEESIIAYCREELAAYKVPKSVEFVDELPKSFVGKVLRRKLRELDIAPAPAPVESGPAS